MRRARAHALPLLSLALFAAACTSAPQGEEGGGAGRSALWVDPDASVLEPRDHRTVTLLHDGTLLVAGGYTADGGVGTAELYDPASGEVVRLPPLIRARWFHSAVMLRNGKVLVLAGKTPPGGGVRTATTELFDPVSRAWFDGPLLAGARERQTATVLRDGRVLVAGNWGGDPAPVELYEPANNVFRSLDAGMLVGRSEHTATRLLDGRVLVAGGFNVSVNDVLASAELFDPATLTWSDAGTFAGKRDQHGASLLPDGRVLIAGGMPDPSGTGAALSTMAVFDPASGAWSATAQPMLDQHADPTLSLLPSGEVLIAGGGGGAATAELFLAGAGATVDAGRMLGRWDHTAVVLPTGEVAIVGGINGGGRLGTVSFYAPPAPGWSTLPDLPAPEPRPAAVVLPDGQALVVGDGSALYDPAGNAWARVPGPAVSRARHTLSLLHSGKVLLAGGGDARCELFDPGTRAWTMTGALSAHRSAHSATVLGDGRVLVAGGTDLTSGTSSLDTAELYDPLRGTWQPAAKLPAPRTGHFATLLPSGRVLLVGGATLSNTALLYDPARDQWSAAGAPFGFPVLPVGSVLPNGRVAVMSGCCAAPAQEYEPQSNTWRQGGAMPEELDGPAGALTFGGKLFVTGRPDGGAAKASTFLYEPRTRGVSALASPTIVHGHASVLRLLDGRLLVVGGRLPAGGPSAAAQVFEEAPAPLARPVLDALPPAIEPDVPFNVTGAGWLGVAEASSGQYDSTASDTPIFRLDRADNGEVHYARLTNWTDGAATALLTGPVNGGLYFARVIIAGASSLARPVLVQPPPTDGGTGGSDGGSGGGSDGGSDGSGGADGGGTPAPLKLRVGCGCGASGSAGPGALGLLLALWARRRGKFPRKRQPA